MIGKTFNNYRIILKKYFVLPVYFRMGGGGLFLMSMTIKHSIDLLKMRLDTKKEINEFIDILTNN